MSVSRSRFQVPHLAVLGSTHCRYFLQLHHMLLKHPFLVSSASYKQSAFIAFRPAQDHIGKNVITSLSTDSTKRIATLAQVLRTEHLWDLVTGLRAQPTPTPDNVNGFTSGSNKFDPVTSQLILAKVDDIYHTITTAGELAHCSS